MSKISFRPRLLFLEHEVDGQDEEDKTDQVIESELLRLEDRKAENHKDSKCNHLLNHLQLHQREWSAGTDESHSVCRYLKAVLEESDYPADGYHSDKWK